MTSGQLEAAVRDSLAGAECVVFDFDGVFTDNRVWVDENGVESVVCSRADGFGLQALREAGLQLFVLSTEVNPVVSARCNKLQIDCVQGLAEKTSALTAELGRRDVKPERTVYMGNDINDLSCMKAVGLSVAVADAQPAALACADLVTETAGGKGAVRELCDLIIECRRQSADASAQ